ncbi:MAG TPA: glycosyltransferase family A protein [Stellaceae bacterium]|nr:glycosyltransferase family A protein [Stellaceae bacterium]
MREPIQRPRLTGISFIVTVFDKRLYLPAVIDALARQEGPFAREFVFVDDGSADGSAELIAELTRGWHDKVLILRQPNRGASAATNEGARAASYPWLKFLDGDDLLVPGATARLLEAAEATNEAFAYGDLGTYRLEAPDPLGDGDPLQAPIIHEPDGLARFIRNCPSNSSTMLVASERYWAAGGCDERLISPDQALFLRLFAAGGGARVMGPVALAPHSAPGRLSEQRRRSRYESVLALYYLVTERKDISRRHRDLAYRRALARARTYHRAFGGPFFSRHLVRYLASFVRVPAEPAAEMYEALAAFTEDGSTERPPAWKPAALRQREAGEARQPVRTLGEV